jgi:DNA (cytosine-5)-methyltransferase 1
LLLSLFCGAGGLDRGFEDAGYEIGLALDRKQDSVDSYNRNRATAPVAKQKDLSDISVEALDALFGSRFEPKGVIGGPPCQSFSQANVNQREGDARSVLPVTFADIVIALHKRSTLDFFVMENVVGLTLKKHIGTLKLIEKKLGAHFHVQRLLLNAKDHGVPQNRPRLFLVGVSRITSQKPVGLVLETQALKTVRQTIEDLPEPIPFRRGVDMATSGVHVNHWCMTPKSPKFTQEGGVRPGVKGRSFKMLSWDVPSIAVAYGHREVHVHPSGRRRLSVYEAMLLQGFPPSYELVGTLSSQIDQVSEAVPPPLARAVADAMSRALERRSRPRAKAQAPCASSSSPKAARARRSSLRAQAS